MKHLLITVALMVIGPLLKKASPIVREKVHELVEKVRDAAELTPNKFDDKLADFLHDVIFGEDDDELHDE